MKLTGRNNTEFTCDDGQCVKMEERCDQLTQCGDHSDEQNCNVPLLQHSYNKKVPPHSVKVRSKKNMEEKRLPVNVSLTLQKVIAIEEVNYSISFKFKINLKWFENRVTYQNLKKDLLNNLLSEDEVKMLWLPRVIYWNTLIKRRRLDWARTGSGQQTSLYKETEKPRGTQLRISTSLKYSRGLKMEQIYTRAFQCVFKLGKYPFDTQVCFFQIISSFELCF